MVHIKNPVEWLFSQLEATVGYAPDHPDMYWPATHAESGLAFEPPDCAAAGGDAGVESELIKLVGRMRAFSRASASWLPPP